MPTEIQVEWVTRVLGVETAATAPPEPSVARADAPRPPSLATLRKTFDQVRGQSPEVALAPLTRIGRELAAAETAEAAAGRPPTPDAVALKRQVDGELAGLARQAETMAAAHLAKWKGDVAALPDGTDQDKRATAIHQVIAEIEQGVARDRYMLGQFNSDARVLTEAEALAASLKAQYKAMLPRRTGVALEGLDAVSRPPIGAKLKPEEDVSLTEAMTACQAQMGADQKVDAATANKAVALIRKGINVENAEKAMKELGNWVAVKKHYRDLAPHDAQGAKDFMAMMWWYRRMKVDGIMTALQEKYDFVWGSVGSDNLESDYDLTVRTHPTKKVPGEVEWDYQIVAIANAMLSEGFDGTPPGILFDTNLYAEAAPKDLTAAEQANPATKAMGAMKEQGQDVGALMKLRRFMEWNEYEDFKDKLLEGITDEADRALVQQQFDNADANYFIARGEQLRKAAEQIGDPAVRTRTIDELEAIPLTVEGQERLAKMAEELEHHDPDKAMAANNAMYVEKLTEVRALEADYTKATDPEAKAGLLALLKTSQAAATFFAAEAYHSEGPLLHIVKAGQSSRLAVEGRPEKLAGKAKADAIEELKQEKLKKLSANQVLQSFNENLGDLLKDLRHYASEPFPGLGFYRSSKYIERLCDAVSVLVTALERESPGAETKLKALKLGGQAPADVRGLVAGLVDIRGEKTGFPKAGAEAENEKQAYAIEQMQLIFPDVVTLPDLAKVIGAFGREVNALVRDAITKGMAASNDSAYWPKSKDAA